MAYSEKQKEYTMKYLEKLKEIRFRVRPEEYQKYEEAAEKAGYPSMRQFYMDAIDEKVNKILNLREKGSKGELCLTKSMG